MSNLITSNHQTFHFKHEQLQLKSLKVGMQISRSLDTEMSEESPLWAASQESL